MADKAWRFRGRFNDAWGPLVPPGQVDDSLHHRLSEHQGPFQLGRIAKDGSVVDKGSWRPRSEAVDAFTQRITADSRIGTEWEISSRREPRWWLKVKTVVYPVGEQVIAAAKTQMGTPYVFGAADPDTDGSGPDRGAFDCSGLTMWAWASVGVKLPHEAEAQRQVTQKVNVPRRGDLVAFDYNPPYGGAASHIGLWLEPGRLIDTRSKSEPVGIRDIEPPPRLLGFWRP